MHPAAALPDARLGCQRNRVSRETSLLGRPNELKGLRRQALSKKTIRKGFSEPKVRERMWGLTVLDMFLSFPQNKGIHSSGAAKQ